MPPAFPSARLGNPVVQVLRHSLTERPVAPPVLGEDDDEVAGLEAGPADPPSGAAIEGTVASSSRYVGVSRTPPAGVT
jgi:hypothetical protein